MRMTGDEATEVAKWALSLLSICFGAVALTAVVAVAPADATKSKSAAVEEAIPNADTDQPMTLIVSLSKQRVDVYRGMTLITSSQVSTGKPGHATKAGVFSILEKQRYHYSNMYGGAPMPWMNRITWSGTALHAGVVPGYPASHGCIRLPYSFAPRLFKITTVGAHVIVAHDRVTPALVDHPALFQPLPPPSPPTLVKQDAPPQTPTLRRSSNDSAPAFGSHLPVVLAKAETVVPDAPQVAEADAEAPAPAPVSIHATLETPAPLNRPVSMAILEDTRVHAIDPNAAPLGAGTAHALGAKPAAVPEPTVADTSSEPAKDQDRLAAPAETAQAPSSPVISASAGSMEQPSAPVPANTAIAMKVLEPQVAEPQVAEPQAGPIFSVSATAVAQPVPAVVSGVITLTSPNGHPPLPPAKPSVMVAKLVAGAAAAAVEAAEPRSNEPLRILVTRSTKRDHLRDAQYVLSSLGYLELQDFDGTFGRQTIDAIKAFQKANGMPETGAFTGDVEAKIYEVAGKDAPPDGHLFVRQKFASVFDAPVSFRNPDEPLGTQVFTVMNFAPGDTKAQWMAIGLRDGQNPTAVLDRLVIPDDIRQNISERLTPGSSLIVADTAINSATLPRGADFLVWDTSKSAKVQRVSDSGNDVAPQPRRKRRVYSQPQRPTYQRRFQGWPF
jgi:L,D-transpeptidase catalytic domain/Putative peptidoglycan binding domain